MAGLERERAIDVGHRPVVVVREEAKRRTPVPALGPVGRNLDDVIEDFKSGIGLAGAGGGHGARGQEVCGVRARAAPDRLDRRRDGFRLIGIGGGGQLPEQFVQNFRALRLLGEFRRGGFLPRGVAGLFLVPLHRVGVWLLAPGRGPGRRLGRKVHAIGAEHLCAGRQFDRGQARDAQNLARPGGHGQILLGARRQTGCEKAGEAGKQGETPWHRPSLTRNAAN